MLQNGKKTGRVWQTIPALWIGISGLWIFLQTLFRFTDADQMTVGGTIPIRDSNYLFLP